MYVGTGKNGDQFLHDLENGAEIKESQLKFGFAVYVFRLVSSIFVIKGCYLFVNILYVPCRLIILKCVQKAILKVKWLLDL